VAVVGSRRATKQGRLFAEALATDLAHAGVIVVSGLAYGVDTSAHRGALAGFGRTVAVLGSGLDQIYPRTNTRLAAEIVDSGGALVSEYADSAGPRKHHFPHRNRLISGLCRAVVVVEASDKSGSLITARLAGEQGRDVMAVPGAVGSEVSKGCHRLIKEGAALVEGAADVLLDLGLEASAEMSQPAAEPVGMRPELERIMRAVDTSVTMLEAIVSRTGLDLDSVHQGLLELELGGFVHAHRGGYIRRPRFAG